MARAKERVGGRATAVMSSDVFDAAIVGAGIVGLATAWQLINRNPGWRIAILEKEDRIAAHQTGRNSGVLHSGIYYKPGSLKAINCRRGLKLMVEFCRQYSIAHDICGKVIVATQESQRPALDKVLENGLANGIRCRAIGPDELRELEPASTGVAAIHVQDTGIVDYPAVCGKLAELIRAAGSEIRTSARVLSMNRSNGSIHLNTTSGTIAAERVINCGGLQSDRITRLSGARPQVRIVPFRGEYYVLRPEARSLVRNLIYPVPDPRYPFLGVHFTRMINGEVECGPNAVLALAREGYRWRDFNLLDLGSTLITPGFWRFARKHWRTAASETWRSLSKPAFVRSLRRLVPAIREQDIRRAASGVRAQAMLPTGDLLDDFAITKTDRIVNVCNAPSPAATASLSIGETIAAHVETIAS